MVVDNQLRTVLEGPTDSLMRPIIEDGEQGGVLQGRCCTCLDENSTCCIASLAVVALLGGGVMIYEGIRCAIETESSLYGLDVRCVVFSGVGCIPFGFGVAKIGKIICTIFRDR